VPSTGHYPIERREGEIARLQMQAAAIEFDAGVMLDRIGVGPGWRCLDLGCGPGGIVELLSGRVGPAGRVVALDADPVFLEHARGLARERRLGNVEFVQGDAYRTGLPRGSFDFVHVRFLAGIVGEPQGLIAEATGLTRPGGTVAFQEPDISTLKCYPPMPRGTGSRRPSSRCSSTSVTMSGSGSACTNWSAMPGSRMSGTGRFFSASASTTGWRISCRPPSSPCAVPSGATT
jgi:SAM-dependent methyltransferase